MENKQMADYILTIKADGGYESTTEGRCTAEQYGKAIAALHGEAPQRKPLTDEELRNLWAKHAARQHDWPNDCTPPVRDIGNGLRFECDWHESEYQVFKAGFKAAHGIKE